MRTNNAILARWRPEGAHHVLCPFFASKDTEMGNSHSFDDDTTYGKDSLFAETDDSSLLVNENGSKAHRFRKNKNSPAVSRTPVVPGVFRGSRHQSDFGRDYDYERREQLNSDHVEVYSPDELTDRDELSAMTDMAWKHLSKHMRSPSDTIELINADEEFSLRQSRDDDGCDRKNGFSSRVGHPMISSSLRETEVNEIVLGSEQSRLWRKSRQSGSVRKNSDQDKYNVRTNSAEETCTRSYSKDIMMEPTPSPESFFGLGDIWRNDSQQSTKSDQSPVYSPRSPVSPSSPRRNGSKHDVAIRMENITSRLDAMTESQQSPSVQHEKVWEHDTFQESLNTLLLQSPQQANEDWNLNEIYARLDELSKKELADHDETTISLTEAITQETIIHDDEINIESDSVIEVQKVDRNAFPFQKEAIKSEPTPRLIQAISKNEVLTVEINTNDREKITDSQEQSDSRIETSVSPYHVVHKQVNDDNVTAGDDASAPHANVNMVPQFPKTAVANDAVGLLITEDFLDQCGNFVTKLVETPLISPCNRCAIQAHETSRIAEHNCHDTSQHIQSTTAEDSRQKETDGLNVKSNSIKARDESLQEMPTSPVGSSGSQSAISDEVDVEFVQKYASLFEAFLTENMDLMDQNSDMISFLYVAKLTKIMAASEKLESAFKKRIVTLRSDKESVLSKYREDLITAAKEKVVKGIQHEQELKTLQETGQIMEGKLKWKLLMENAHRARSESMLLQTLWKTTMDMDAPLESLPAGQEIEVIRQAAIAASSTTSPASEDVLLKDIRRFQMENNFLNAEISVLEGKLNQRRQTANTHLWVDSVFRRLGAKPKKPLKD
ncbi:hypothetical protein FisN_3Lh133 [Fistulifera solaris]|uniref:Uncharacterized protein n=1 Tax=Fistulifera solaris TaxID=1519565 RepID=A0A1Z5JHT4_FISSO|nr:hypothetical protein FisN_3Lh133 [Fistulifera solaris]|eukprot:GAX13565.1 hypothetical protein FisN_3Lh133 [Fistulifera solaris]